MPRVQRLAEQAFRTLQRFLHVEAVSGVTLLVAAAGALILANSPLAHGYHDFWNLQLSFGIGDYVFSRSLHFWVNDALMTAFFLVVGMEIRREIHEGALSRFDQAILPLVAASGGVIVPALIYLALNRDPAGAQGWAVPPPPPTHAPRRGGGRRGRARPGAGRGGNGGGAGGARSTVPGQGGVVPARAAIIDDIIAVLIIAVFYTASLQFSGFAVALLGMLAVVGFQRIGIGSAPLYLLPGSLVWAGFLMAGVHPTLAGVVLGLMTPASPLPMREQPLEMVSRVLKQLRGSDAVEAGDAHRLEQPLRDLRLAHREILPPVSRVQMAMHPWVAYGVMPIFALANAGVSLAGADLSAAGRFVMLGTALALIAGKPLGIVGATWVAVKLGWCRLAPGVSWGGVCLVGLLAGIGFTMSIFIAMLAFTDEAALTAAKLGVLIGSLGAATLGIGWGIVYVRRQ